MTMRLVSAACVMALGAAAAQAQNVAPQFAPYYSLQDLGSVPGLPEPYGGMVFKRGDPSKILIGGEANSAPGALYEVEVVRDANQHVIGFAGPAVRVADAPFNYGGVVYAPNGTLLLARWPSNELGQTKRNSSVTDKIVDLEPFGVEESIAALNYIPNGFPNSGALKIVTWEGGQWGDLVLAPDGNDTFDVVSFTEVAASRLPGGPEGFFYPSRLSPLFGAASLLVCEFSDGRISRYLVDANGDPRVETRRDFVQGLDGAEGAAVDPITGDFFFSTFGVMTGDRLIAVQGFVPAPGAGVLAGAAMLAALRRRRGR